MNIYIMLEKKCYTHVDYVAMCNKNEDNLSKRQKLCKHTLLYENI